jgi:DNA adenine methylase
MTATSSWKPTAVAHQPTLFTDEGSPGEEQHLLASRDLADASTVPAQPFLRWAGGKRWLLHHLPHILEGFEIKGYHEPFLGGGAVFFGTAGIGQGFLSDLNGELIEAYTQIRDDPELVADALVEHVNTKEHYYEVRRSEPRTASGRAARFIYLNHTSYNGIYRVNLKGQYNVPYGNRTWGGLPSRELLVSVSQKLRGVSLDECDFEKVVSRAQAGDFVFLDPPYTVAHNNNGFVKYNQKLFSFEDQVRLSEVIDRLREVGAYYLLTNAAHDSIAELFEKGDRRIELSRGSSVGGKQAKRGSATEYIFTNVSLS